MRIDARLGTFEDVVAAAPQHAATLAKLRELAAQVHPDAVETASRRERSISWGFGGGKQTHWYAYAMPHRAHVNLGFFHGTRLPDPEGLLTGTGKSLRHVKISTPDGVEAPAIRALMIAAHDERRAALSIDE